MRNKIAAATMWVCGLALVGLLAIAFSPRSSAVTTIRAPSPGLCLTADPNGRPVWRSCEPRTRCAQIGPLPCVTPLPPPPSPQTLTFQTSNTTCTGSSCSLTSQTFGSVCPNRLIVVSLAFLETSTTNVTASGSTIGGVSATLVKEQNVNNGTNTAYAGVISAAVPTGTTGTISLSFNVSLSRGTLGLYTICNLNSTTAGATAGQSNSNTLTLSVNTLVGGVGVAAALNNNAGGSNTWTGATADFTGTTGPAYGASFSGATAQTPRTITLALTACGTMCSGVSATWQ